MKAQSAKLASVVLSSARDGLTSDGWRKRSGEIYTIDLAPEVIGWLGLNRAVGRGGSWMTVNPVIGVRHQTLERTLADLLEEKFHPYNPPTIRVNLGYLMPGQTVAQWGFGPGEDNASRVRDLVESVRRHGLPFLQATTSLRSILDKLLDPTSSFGINIQTAFRVPVAYLLLGDHASARSYLDKQVRLLGQSQVDEEEYRRFAENLSRRL